MENEYLKCKIVYKIIRNSVTSTVVILERYDYLQWLQESNIANLCDFVYCFATWEFLCCFRGNTFLFALFSTFQDSQCRHLLNRTEAKTWARLLLTKCIIFILHMLKIVLYVAWYLFISHWLMCILKICFWLNEWA